MASTAVSNNPLHAPFTFSFMRRGGGNKGKSEDAADAPAGAAATTSAGAATGGAAASGGASAAAGAGAGSTTAPAAATNPLHPYENSIKNISTVSTVESFWETYDYLRRPGDLPTTTDYHFFRQGIKPTWEDPSNAKGGKWIVRLPKGLANRYWEEIMLALIGAQFSGVPADEVCGAVLSVRYSEDILGVWNRTSHDTVVVERIRDSVKKILLLPPHANMEYKPHQNSMQDRSSFRNTQVWKPKSLESRSVSASATVETRRSGSWTETTAERKPKRDMGRAWR